jgi:23S rRNA (pseudouridine1915-N3)-methyltransferase
MKFSLYNIGKSNIPYLQQGIRDYSIRINHFIDFSVIDLPAVKHSKSLTPVLLCQKEGELLKPYLMKCNMIILLDEKGKEYTSRDFSEYLNRLMNQGAKQIAFVTGGAYGFSEDVRKMASHTLALSQMTFTHEMVRLVFLEQLYRALTLIKGIPYHND